MRTTKGRSLLSSRVALRDRYALWGAIFIVPTVVFFLVFRIIPLMYSLAASLTQWNLVRSMRFVGLANYLNAFKDRDFLLSLQRSFEYAVFVVAFTVSIALVLAVLFDQGVRFRNFYRAAYFLPTVISWVVIAITWRTMYNPTVGVIAFLGDLFGFKPFAVLTSTRYALGGIIVVGIWHGIGYFMVIFLAGLQAIDPNLYEAAVIDGATSFKKFLYITVPLLKPTIFFVLVMSTMGSLQVFPQVYVMTRGGPAESTIVAVYYIYRKAFYMQEMGYGSALAVILFVIILSVTLLYRKFFGTQRYYS